MCMVETELSQDIMIVQPVYQDGHIALWIKRAKMGRSQHILDSRDVRQPLAGRF